MNVTITVSNRVHPIAITVLEAMVIMLLIVDKLCMVEDPMIINTMIA